MTTCTITRSTQSNKSNMRAAKGFAIVVLSGVGSAVLIVLLARFIWVKATESVVSTHGISTALENKSSTALIAEFVDQKVIEPFDPKSRSITLLPAFSKLPDDERVKLCQLCWYEWFLETDQRDNSECIQLKDETGGTYGWYSELGGIEVNFPPEKTPKKQVK